MELHCIKGKESRSDLQLAVSGWKNKVMDTESDESFVESGRQGKSFVHGQGWLSLEKNLSK